MIKRALVAFGTLFTVGGLMAGQASAIIAALVCWGILGFLFYRKHYAKF